MVNDFIILHPWLRPTDQWEQEKLLGKFTAFHLRNFKDPLLTLIRPNPFPVGGKVNTGSGLLPSPSPDSHNSLCAAGSGDVIDYFAVLNYFFYPALKELAGHALHENSSMRLQHGFVPKGCRIITR